MKQCERLNKIIIHASTSPLPATMEELSNGQEIFFKLLIQTEASLLHRCYRILLNIDVWQLCEGEFGWVRVWYEKTNKQTNIFLRGEAGTRDNEEKNSLGRAISILG